MAAIFQSWIFWLMVGVFIIHLLCKPSVKEDEERKRMKRILWEQGIFGVDVYKDMKLQGAPLFKCFSEVYNKAFDVIFLENQTTITIDGIRYNFARNIKAFEIYEKITHKRFTLYDIHDIYILIYCLLVVNNPSMSLRIDEFLTNVEEIEKEGISSSCLISRNKKKRNKNNKERHVPNIFEERTNNLIQKWNVKSEKELETSFSD